MLDDKFTFTAVDDERGQVVMLKGMIDEDTDFEPIKSLGPPFIFNFKDVTSINSIGIRSWVNFIKALGQVDIVYEQCPPGIVRQMNMIPSFVGVARVRSVFVPYVCVDCEMEKLVLVTEDQFAGENVTLPDQVACPKCQEAGRQVDMELDGHTTQYFAFLK